jgi:hypothetical protein
VAERAESAREVSPFLIRGFLTAVHSFSFPRSIPDLFWFWSLGLGFLFLETKKAIRLIKSGRIRRSRNEPSPSEVDSVFSAAEEAIDAHHSSTPTGKDMQRRMSKKFNGSPIM